MHASSGRWACYYGGPRARAVRPLCYRPPRPSPTSDTRPLRVVRSHRSVAAAETRSGLHPNLSESYNSSLQLETTASS